jgi:hypothetical protein
VDERRGLPAEGPRPTVSASLASRRIADFALLVAPHLSGRTPSSREDPSATTTRPSTRYDLESFRG